MTLSIKDLCDLFDRMGWHINKKDDNTIWCLFSGDKRDFMLGVYLNDQWVSFSIPNYLPHVPLEKRDSVGKVLLEANNKMRLTKFALLEDGEVILAADLPALVKINFDLFAVYVDVITYYANSFYDELYQLITGHPYNVKENPSHE
jgi:hypothetical protein